MWGAPFIMAPVNTRVVRRSNAVLGHQYGEHVLLLRCHQQHASRQAPRSSWLSGGSSSSQLKRCLTALLRIAFLGRGYLILMTFPD